MDRNYRDMMLAHSPFIPRVRASGSKGEEYMNLISDIHVLGGPEGRTHFLYKVWSVCN